MKKNFTSSTSNRHNAGLQNARALSVYHDFSFEKNINKMPASEAQCRIQTDTGLTTHKIPKKVFYKQIIQPMNIFTYLRQAVTYSLQLLKGDSSIAYNRELQSGRTDFAANHLPNSIGRLDVLWQIGAVFKRNQQISRSFISGMAMMLFTALGVFAQTGVDLRVKATIDNKLPSVGQKVTYRVVVKNEGTAAAAGVVVTNTLPAFGTSYDTHTIVRGTGTYTGTSGAWNVGAIAAGDSAVVDVKANVLLPGVWFDLAEVTAMTGTDIDSTPNNGVLTEDDIATTCFSVPLVWYPGDEYTITIPKKYRGANLSWTKDGSPITASTKGVTATDSSLVTSVTGEFAFTNYFGNCPSGGCCTVKIVQGAYGQIGDYVWNDLNKNGIQDDGATAGVDNFKVELYEGTTLIRTTFTKGGGKYLFDSLQSGNYQVKFVLPDATNKFTTANINGGSGNPGDALDSDAGTNGLTHIITIDVNKPTTDSLRRNLNIDAGLVPSIDPVFDLALAKSLASGQSAQVAPGDKVKYTLTVTNEGNVTATAVQLKDYVPTGMTFDPADNPLWTLSSGNPVTTIAGPIAGGGTASVNIILTVNVDFTGTELINNAEINSHKDGNGKDIKDKDSTPGNGIGKGEDDEAKVPVSIKKTCPTLTLTVTGSKSSICVNDSVLVKGVSTGATSIKWYYAAVGGSEFKTTQTGDAFYVAPTSTTTYYAEAFGAANCPSSGRQPVTVIVNVRPANPTCKGTASNICPALTVNLNDNIVNLPSTTGGVFEWHTGMSPTSPLVADPTKAGAGTYYLFEKSKDGCYSNPTLLTVNITPCDCTNPATVDAGTPITVCAGTASVTLAGKIGGGATSATWTTSGTGTFDNANSLTAKYTPSTADMTAGNVTLTLTTNVPTGSNCKAAISKVLVTFSPKPTVPFGLQCDSLICAGGSTKLFAVSPNNTIKWYTTATGGTAIGTANSSTGLVVSPTVTTTYYAEAVNAAGCVSERVSITVTVKKCLTDLAVVKTVLETAPYSKGQTITYSIEAKNIGSVNATGVKVKDCLPASLTYSNSVPAGYNASTCEWTIGNLTAGSSKILIITATVNAVGTITNTAEISSPDEDPTKVGPENKSTVTIEVKQDCKTTTPPSITCTKTSICAGETVTLNAIGCTGTTIMWSNGATGASISVSPTDNTTYYAYCKDGDCKSANSNEMTIKVTKLPAPTITSDVTQTCSGGDVTLTAKGCTGGVRWSNGDTGYTIVANPTATTTYYAKCQIGDCVSDASNSITITIGPRPTAPTVICSKTEICKGESLQLTAVGCEKGEVMWSNWKTGQSITVAPVVTTAYFATCTINGCTSDKSSDYTIKVITPTAPTVTASASSICAGQSVTLKATGCDGTVIWSNGKIGAEISVSPSLTTSYTAKCTGTNCSSDNSAPVEVTVSNPTTPIITASATTVCPGSNVTLKAVGCENGYSVLWSTGATTTEITTTLDKTTDFSAQCTKGDCKSAKSNTITVSVGTVVAPTITASANTVCKGASVTLTASGCNGTIKWSNGMTGASITVPIDVTTKFSATCESSTCKSGKSNELTINVGSGGTPPTLACANTTICPGESATITAVGCTGGKIKWSTGEEGVSSIIVKPTTNTSYTAKCVFDAGCESTNSAAIDITVKPTSTPTITVTSDKNNVCVGTQVTLTAAGCSSTVTWSSGGTGTTTTVTVSATTTYTATCAANGCANEAKGSTTVTTVPQPGAPTITCTTSSICPGGSVTLTAKGCDGSVLWSTGETATSITVSPATTTTYTVKCIVGGCTSPASAGAIITVGNPTAPKITASAPSVCAGGTVTLNAEGCTTGTVIWSNGKIGNSVTIKPSATDSYTAVCSSGTCVGDKSNAVTVTVNAKPTAPDANDATNICPATTVDLKTTLVKASSTVEFHQGSVPTSPLITAPVATSGIYYAFEKSAAGCYSDPVDVNIVIIKCNETVDCAKSPARVDAGADATICADKAIQLNGTIGGAASSARWTTLGSGTFDTPSALNTIYRVSASDMSKGSVKLVLTSNDPDGTGPCKAASDTVLYTLNGISIKPKLTVVGNTTTTTCGADSVVITAPTGYTYRWNNSTTTTTNNKLVVKTSGSYWVTLIDAKGCMSVNSDTVTTSFGTPVQAPALSTSSVNVCAPATVNLNQYVTATGSPNLVLEFRTGSSPTSSLVATPTAVGAGTYYAFYKSGTCYSAASKFEVKAFCQPNSADADLTVTITSDKDKAAVDEVVTFTIKVKNNGPATAKNVKVSHTIPSGFEFVSSTGGLAKDNNVLSAAMDSLQKNGEVVYTYKVKMKSPSDIVTAEFAATTTTNDPNPSDNKASKGIAPTTGGSPNADVAITITADKTSVPKGTEVTFTVKVKNNGTGTAKGIKVSDVLNNFTFSSGDLVKSGDTLKASIDSLINGAEKQYVFKAIASTQGTGVSSAFVKSTTTDPVLSNNSASTAVTITGTDPNSADLAVTMTVNPTEVVKDSTVIFTIKVKNNGPATAKNIKISDVLPSGLTFVSGDLTKTGDTLKASLDSLVNGGEKVYIVKAKATGNKGVELTNSATAKAITTDPNSSNNTGSATTKIKTDVVLDGADLAVIFTPSKPIVAVGDTIIYTLKVKNNGPLAAQNIEIANIIPSSNLLFISGLDFIKAGDTLIAKIGNLANGLTSTFTYKAKVTAITNKIDNPAQITKSSQPDPVSTNNSATATVFSKADSSKLADLAIVITPNKKTIAKDSVVTYTIVVKNNGPSTPAKNVVLSNLLPSDLDFVSGDLVKSGDTLKATITKVAKDTAVTLTYKAKVKVANKKISSTITIVSSDKIDPVLTNNTSTAVINDTTDTVKPGCIGLALSIEKIQKQTADSSFTVTYVAILKNCGTVPLSNVQLTDTLTNTFKSPVTYTVVGTPTASAGLTPNPNFNGNTDVFIIKPDSSTIAPGVIDTVRFVVNVKAPKTSNGPFNNSAYTQGKTPTNDIVKDKSNAGKNPDTPGDESTKLYLNLPKTLIGIAKKVAAPVKVSDNEYDLEYTLTLRNYGENNLKKVAVYDSLDKTFPASKGIVVTNTKITLNGDPGLTVNKNYTGRGLNTALLVPDSSSLAAGESKKITFKIRINTSAAKSTDFSNIAYAKGTAPDSTTNTDQSTDGEDPDTNGNLNPNDDSTPTRTNLQPASDSLAIGLALKADTARQNNGSYNITFTLKAKNWSGVGLKKIQIVDSLATVFGTNATWRMVQKPSVVSGTVRVDSNYNGSNIVKLLVPDSSRIAKGDSAIIKFVVNVDENKSSTAYLFSASVIGTSVVDSTKTATDISTDGVDTAPNASKNPKLSNVPTPVTLPIIIPVFSVPGGFSPNNDGQNDVFKVKGIQPGQKVDFQVYNRWGHMVYSNDDYLGDWDGKANQGLGAGDLPDGTYYIVVRVRDAQGNPVQVKDGNGNMTNDYVSYITIAR